MIGQNLNRKRQMRGKCKRVRLREVKFLLNEFVGSIFNDKAKKNIVFISMSQMDSHCPLYCNCHLCILKVRELENKGGKTEQNRPIESFVTTLISKGEKSRKNRVTETYKTLSAAVGQ